MAEPLDGVTAIHNAFRRDMSGIDTAAFDSARGKPGLASAIERFRFFNEVLVWHAYGEELAIFPAVEAVAPSVAEAYERDHRGLDAAFDALNAAVSARDALDTARATAAFKFHLDIHLAKEDAHLYRLMRERVPMPEQGKAVGIMASTVPQDRFPEVVAWLYPLIDHDDRENMTRIWQMVMPAPAFAQARQLIQAAIGNDWAELTRRIPTLAQKVAGQPELTTDAAKDKTPTLAEQVRIYSINHRILSKQMVEPFYEREIDELQLLDQGWLDKKIAETLLICRETDLPP